jgi:hypothetical protein
MSKPDQIELICGLCGKPLIHRFGRGSFHVDQADDKPCAEMFVKQYPRAKGIDEIMGRMQSARTSLQAG